MEEYNNYFIINPSYKVKKNKLKKIFEYNSKNNTKFLSPEEIRKLIKENQKTSNNIINDYLWQTKHK